MLNKSYSLKHFVYLVGLHIYYKMTHGLYSVKLQVNFFTTEKYFDLGSNFAEESQIFMIITDVLPLIKRKKERKKERHGLS